VLGPERGAKGVDIAQRAGLSFNVELTGYGKEGRFFEEIFLVLTRFELFVLA
jgi:hypothetical protein